MQAPNHTTVISYSQTDVSIMHPFIQGLNNLYTQTDFGIVEILPLWRSFFFFNLWEKKKKKRLKCWGFFLNLFSHFVITSTNFKKH